MNIIIIKSNHFNLITRPNLVVVACVKLNFITMIIIMIILKRYVYH